MAVVEEIRVLSSRMQWGMGLSHEGVGTISREAEKEKGQWKGHSQQRACPGKGPEVRSSWAHPAGANEAELERGWVRGR